MNHCQTIKVILRWMKSLAGVLSLTRMGSSCKDPIPGITDLDLNKDGLQQQRSDPWNHWSFKDGFCKGEKFCKVVFSFS